VNVLRLHRQLESCRDRKKLRGIMVYVFMYTVQRILENLCRTA
jgi:hypothetical protein